MSSHAVEPGNRLVDRYRLERHLGETDGASYWRAQDELLDRPVGLCLLPATDSQAGGVLRSARRAAALSDTRFLRVLDASEVDGVVYVVSEWVSATSLVDLLADGPLSPGAARDLAEDLADALAVAHREGLAHLCLQPEHVLQTAHGQLKIGGLAVEAAARGLAAEGPDAAARRDTEGAAAVAYAAVTGRWPGSAPTGLAPAPRDGDHPCTTRQVRAGVPHDLDEAVSRGLGLPGGHGAPLSRPEELAQALAAVHIVSRSPSAPPGSGRATDDTPSPFLPYDDEAPRRHNRLAVLAWSAVVLVLVVGLGLAGSQILRGLGGGDQGADASDPTSSGSPTSSAQPTGARLDVRRVTTLDPPPDGSGDENGYAAERVLDSDRDTVWTTKEYNDPFGPAGLKEGVGLVLDLGSRQDIGSVTVVTAGGGTDFELRTANERGSTLEDYAEMASARDVLGRAVLRPTDRRRARYLLLWLTSLPAEGGVYRGGIAEVAVRG